MPRSQTGGALPSVLIIVTVLGVMAAAFVHAIRYDVVAARYDIASSQLGYLAEAAVERAIADLVIEEPVIPRDGTAYVFTLGRTTLTARVWDEKGKIDLNLASTVLIRNLLEVLEETAGIPIDVQTIADSVEDRRFKVKSNESPAFRSVYELAEIEGVTDDVFALLAPLTTIAAYDGKINTFYADAIVLAAIPGVTNNDIARILAAREKGDAIAVPAAAAWTTTAEGPFYRITGEAVAPTGKRSRRDVVVWAPEDRAPMVVESRPAY